MITMFLTLKDRPEYSESWVKHNIFPEFSYFVADGSIGNENEFIFGNLDSKNLTYVRYPPDIDYKTYLKKRISGLEKIKTPFVLNCDNDDYLLKDGLLSMQKHLSTNPDITLLQGCVGTVLEVSRGKYRRFKDWEKCVRIDSNRYSALRDVVKHYYSLWYGVSKTEEQKTIIETIYKSGTSNPYLTEEFQTYLSLARANVSFLPVYYYVRLANAAGSQHQTFADRYRYDAVLNDSFNMSFGKLVDSLTEYFPSVTRDVIYNILREHQIAKLGDNSISLKERLKNAICFKLTEITIKVNEILTPVSVSAEDVNKLFQKKF